MHDARDKRDDLATTLRLGLVAVAATMALWLLAAGFRQFDCRLLPLLALALAWPIWAYRREQLLFTRRLLLAAATVPDGRLRRWLWAGSIRQAIEVPLALVWALLLLVLASRLGPLEWAVLLADAALLAVAAPKLRRLLALEVAPGCLGAVSRAAPVLALNVLLLMLAFSTLSYFAGFADTRALTWDALVGQAFDAGVARAYCPFAGWLIGVANLAEALPRHAAMLTLPGLVDPGWRLLAWMLFLALTGLGAYLFTRLLLGAFALAAPAEAGAPAPAAAARDHGLFVLTAVVMLALAWLGVRGATAVDWRVLGQATVQSVQRIDPCGAEVMAAVAERERAGTALDLAARAAVDAAMVDVDRQLDETFRLAEQGVDVWLDWYFSLVGSYTRLLSPVIPGLERSMRDAFERHVLNETRLDARIQAVAGGADTMLAERIALAGASIGDSAASRFASSGCRQRTLRIDALPGLQRDALRTGLAASIAVPLSAIALRSAATAGQALVARLFARQATRAAAGAAGAAASRRGSSIALSAATATALCAPGGPMALACGGVAAVVVWLGVDVVLIRIDSALFRDKMRAELVAELQAHRDILSAQLRKQLEQRAQDYRIVAMDRVEALFVPARN